MRPGDTARLPSPLVELREPRLAESGVRLLLKRDDLIHPGVPGNKWRKLAPNLREAERRGCRTLLTFGGAYSSHVYAVANAAALWGMRSIGLIRGEERLPLNPVLAHARAAGMELHYVDRATYREKARPEYLASLRERFGEEFFPIPEGGSNELGVRGAAEIVAEIDEPFDAICCACGTGGTLAGLASALPAGAEAIGVAVLKGAEFLRRDVGAWLTAVGSRSDRWEIVLDHHFGGYAKTTPALLRFVDEFEARHGVVLDPIYTGKAMYAVFDLVARGRFAPGSRVVAVHTGGAPRAHWAGLLDPRAVSV